LTDTAFAAPVTPRALRPATAAYSDFLLNVFMVGEDSFDLPFKVITLEPTAQKSYYSSLLFTNELDLFDASPC